MAEVWNSDRFDNKRQAAAITNRTTTEHQRRKKQRRPATPRTACLYVACCLGLAGCLAIPLVHHLLTFRSRCLFCQFHSHAHRPKRKAAVAVVHHRIMINTFFQRHSMCCINWSPLLPVRSVSCRVVSCCLCVVFSFSFLFLFRFLLGATCIPSKATVRRARHRRTVNTDGGGRETLRNRIRKEHTHSYTAPHTPRPPRPSLTMADPEDRYLGRLTIQST